jgi:hypothetical protein
MIKLAKKQWVAINYSKYALCLSVLLRGAVCLISF